MIQWERNPEGISWSKAKNPCGPHHKKAIVEDRDMSHQALKNLDAEGHFIKSIEWDSTAGTGCTYKINCSEFESESWSSIQELLDSRTWGGSADRDDSYAIWAISHPNCHCSIIVTYDPREGMDEEVQAKEDKIRSLEDIKDELLGSGEDQTEDGRTLNDIEEEIEETRDEISDIKGDMDQTRTISSSGGE